MALDIVVIGRGKDFGVDGALEVGDFFGTFVDEEDHYVAFGVVFFNACCDVLEEGGFTGARGGDDEAALAFADWAEEVDDTVGHSTVFGFYAQLFIGSNNG